MEVDVKSKGVQYFCFSPHPLNFSLSLPLLIFSNGDECPTPSFPLQPLIGKTVTRSPYARVSKDRVYVFDLWKWVTTLRDEKVPDLFSDHPVYVLRPEVLSRSASTETHHPHRHLSCTSKEQEMVLWRKEKTVNSGKTEDRPLRKIIKSKDEWVARLGRSKYVHKDVIKGIVGDRRNR